jgi:quercetin dioxygenase-like cupin family protein
MSIETYVSRAQDGEKVPTGFGELNWKISAATMDGSEMTFGTCYIRAGQRNALHSHPDCEELLYIVRGVCEHRLGDETIMMQPGDAIRIPRNIVHWARAAGEEDLFALIVFSSGTRTAISHEGDGIG